MNLRQAELLLSRLDSQWLKRSCHEAKTLLAAEIATGLDSVAAAAFDDESS